MNFRPGQPFVGTSAFAHKGGMHVHGVRKNAASYEHIDPATVGNERRVLVSELSGKSNIAEKLGEVRPRARPGAAGQGPRPGAGPGERGLPVRGGRGVVRPAGREGWPAGTRRGSSGSATASASRASADGDARHRGDGQAPRRRRRSSTPSARATARSTPSTAPCARRWSRTIPGSAEMQLVDYKVRVINARAGTAARVRVVIESKRRRRRLGHGRRQRERHRGELAGPGRRLRAQARQGRPREPPPAAARRWPTVAGTRPEEIHGQTRRF